MIPSYTKKRGVEMLLQKKMNYGVDQKIFKLLVSHVERISEERLTLKV